MSNSKFNNKDTTLIPIAKANELLATSSCQLILQKLQYFLGIPKKRYQQHYLATIENFVEFTQSLPATKHDHYAHQNGFLELGLERAFEVLKHHRKHRPGSSTSHSPKNEDLELQRWEFVLFTAALFFDLGKLGADFFVMICDAKGKAIKQWQPLQGSMLHLGTHFRFSFTADNPHLLRHSLTPLLARQLLPKTSLEWIATDKYVLQSWLSLLENINHEDTGASSGGRSYVLVADAFVINAFNKDLKEQQQASDKSEAKRGIEKDIRDILSKQAQKQMHDSAEAAQAFLAWLQHNVQNGKADVNGKKSNVHIVKEGAFLAFPQAFQDFAKSHSQFGSWDNVYKQFKDLGLTLRDQKGNDIINYHVGQDKTKLLAKGIVLADLTLLYPTDIQRVYSATHVPVWNHDFKITGQVFNWLMKNQFPEVFYTKMLNQPTPSSGK